MVIYLMQRRWSRRGRAEFFVRYWMQRKMKRIVKAAGFDI